MIPRDDGPIRASGGDAFWTWHAANAYELDEPAAGNPVVLNCVEWDASSCLVPGRPPRSGGRLARATIDPAAGLAHAPRPGSDDPDDGWWLTFATHRATRELC